MFAALCVGTVLTVTAAGHDFGAFNTPIALGIAATKATLVILYFMHVKYSSGLTKLVVATGVFFLVILLSETMMDYVSKGFLQLPTPLQ